jgi:hypothetical protein
MPPHARCGIDRALVEQDPEKACPGLFGFSEKIMLKQKMQHGRTNIIPATG